MTLASLPTPTYTGADLRARLDAALTEVRAARRFASVAALLADATMAYGAGARAVAAGDIVEAGGHRYEVATSGATDHHVTTAGGVRLYVRAFAAVLPRAFGVVGDGAADDTERARTAHAYANALGLPVSYAGVGQIALQADAQIVVNTSTDFAGCRVVVLGGMVGNPDYLTPRTLFRVHDEATPVVTGFAAPPAADLREDALAPTASFFQGPGFAYFQGSGGTGPQIAGRQDGDAPLSYRQSFAVNRNGRANHPLSRDMSAETQVWYRTRAMPARGRITISGLRIDPSQFNNQVVLSVERNAVTVRDILIVPPTGAYNIDSVNRLIWVKDAAHVTVEDVTATAQYTSSAEGTYVLTYDNVAELHVSRVVALNGWGQMGGSHCNGLHVRDCTINRVDAHSGGHNIFVSGGTLQDIGVVYGWGGGVLSVKGVKLIDCPAISSRVDYGGYFFGDLIVEGVELTSQDFGETVVDLGANPIGHPLLAVPAPRGIVVRGVNRSGQDGNGNSREIVPVHLAVKPAALGVTAPASIHVSDITCGANWRWRLIVDYANMVADATNNDRPRLALDNIKGTRTVTDANGGLYVPPNTIAGAGCGAEVFAADCHQLDLNTAAANQTMRHTITDCHVTALRTPNTAGVHMVGGRLGTPRLVGAETVSPVGGAAPASHLDRTTLIGVRVEASAWDLSRAMALQGVMIPSTVTATLPATVTKATAFSGWISGSY